MFDNGGLVEVKDSAITAWFKYLQEDDRLIDVSIINPMGGMAENCAYFLESIFSCGYKQFNKDGNVHIWAEWVCDKADEESGHTMTIDAIDLIDSCTHSAASHVAIMLENTQNQTCCDEEERLAAKESALEALETMQSVKQRLLEVVAKINDAQRLYDLSVSCASKVLEDAQMLKSIL